MMSKELWEYQRMLAFVRKEYHKLRRAGTTSQEVIRFGIAQAVHNLFGVKYGPEEMGDLIKSAGVSS